MQEPFKPRDLDSRYTRAEKVNYGISPANLHDFEAAIDSLRKGDTYAFLWHLSSCRNLFSFNLPEYLPTYDDLLPYLNTDNYKEGLPAYKAYSEFLRSQNL